MTDDLKALWRRQPLEEREMDIQDLRASARTQLARIRRARILLVLGALAGASLAVCQAVFAPTGLLRVGEILLAGGFVVLLAVGWRRLALPPPDTAEACMAFLRESLIRRRNAVRGGWLTLIAPLLPGLGVNLVALAIASEGKWLRLAPIAAVLALWLVILLAIQAREASRVSAEIAQLDRLNGLT